MSMNCELIEELLSISSFVSISGKNKNILTVAVRKRDADLVPNIVGNRGKIIKRQDRGGMSYIKVEVLV